MLNNKAFRLDKSINQRLLIGSPNDPAKDIKDPKVKLMTTVFYRQ